MSLPSGLHSSQDVADLQRYRLRTGMQIEAYLDNETLTTCKNESGYKWNASEPGQNVGYPITSKLWYGMVTPFVNTSVAGWVWCESRLPLAPPSPPCRPPRSLRSRRADL